MPWDIGGWEFFVIAVVTVLVFGPKELPVVLRNVGKWMSKARAMARDFQRSFEQMAKETELDQLRKEVNELKGLDPTKAIRRDLERSIAPDDFDGLDPTVTHGPEKRPATPDRDLPESHPDVPLEDMPRSKAAAGADKAEV